MSDYDHLTPQNTPLGFVDWHDIVAHDNWEGEDDKLQPVECVTAGWLLEETSTVIRIASSYDWKNESWGTLHAFSKFVPTFKAIEEVDK